MHTLISYPAGVILEAVIVSQTSNSMRVVAAGISDAFELRLSGTKWLTERDEQVEFEFLALASDFPEEARPSAEIAQRAGSI